MLRMVRWGVVWAVVVVEAEEVEGREKSDAQGKVLQAKIAWAGSIVKGLAPSAVGAKNRTTSNMIARRAGRTTSGDIEAGEDSDSSALG